MWCPVSLNGVVRMRRKVGLGWLVVFGGGEGRGERLYVPL